jgi:hypothetical protein
MISRNAGQVPRKPGLSPQSVLGFTLLRPQKPSSGPRRPTPEPEHAFFEKVNELTLDTSMPAFSLHGPRGIQEKWCVKLMSAAWRKCSLAPTAIVSATNLLRGREALPCNPRG